MHDSHVCLRTVQDAATPSTLARLLDVNGTVVQLPLDLREPFARFVARQQIRHMKRWVARSGCVPTAVPHATTRTHIPRCRFCVGPVYRGGIARDSTPTGGQPKHVQEADFDVVWTVPSTAAAVASGSGKPPRTPGMDEAGGTDRRWSPQVAVLEAEVLTVAAEVRLLRPLHGYVWLCVCLAHSLCMTTGDAQLLEPAVRILPAHQPLSCT